VESLASTGRVLLTLSSNDWVLYACAANNSPVRLRPRESPAPPIALGKTARCHSLSVSRKWYRWSPED
jgi:hypothetical protein